MSDEVRHDTEEDTSPPPAWLSVPQAARAARVSERSIHRWIRSGRLSATTTPRGRRIALAELLRVAEVSGAVPPGSDTESQDPARTARHVTGELAGLRVEVDQLRARLAAAEQERERWYQVAHGFLQALPPPAPRRPWWAWWRR